MLNQIGKIALLSLLGLMFMAGLLTAATNTCTDGTKYYECSKTKPGYYCTASTTLDKAIGTTNYKGEASDIAKKCACANFAGYVEVDGECVKTTCTANSKTYNTGDCDKSNLPKQCSWGSWVSNSSACGCAVGNKSAANGKDCEARIGCRWGNIATPSGKECKYDASNPNDDGTLIGKSGCVNGNPSCDWDEDCDTSSDANGVCVTKKGCQYSNPACGSGKVCNQVTGVCDSADTVSTTPILGSTTTTNTSGNGTKTSGSSNGVCCCPLPALGMVGLVALASARRMGRKDEE